ncbi:hypothetical protein NONO_c62930 [Nocardia nova SH22a]|uniref:TPR repeat domain-containing protein n=1 Tax=Nocardia nova SH22a TaxID=1415166 RepID=W5TQ34_9NOCA|nr:hypothetical protein [Nocardia nova]AHH21063.1 hypothetical protein NONO_c62930 [Nocardia nova SH22a]
MAIPPKSQVMGWKTGALGEIAADAAKIRDAIDTDADMMNRTIHGLDWSGAAFEAAADRADREKTQQRAVATAYDDLATALQGAEGDTGWLIEQIQSHVRNNSFPGWTIGEDYVIDTHDVDNPDLQQRADNATASLKSLSQQLGEAIDKWAPKIAEAVGSISGTAPATAEKHTENPADQFTAQQAEADLEAVRNGTADAATLERLRAATDLTPEDKDALANGKGVNLPQFEYLQALSKGMNGMSGEDIANLGSKLGGNGHDQVQSAVADGFRIVSDPQVHAAGLDGAPSNASGGMNQLPDTVQRALTNDPVKSIPFGSHHVNNWDDLRAIDSIMSKGDKTIQGSDINRGMLKQGAEIAAASNPDAYFDVNTKNAANLADGLLSNASGDHAAIHDAVLADANAPAGSDARAAADRMGVTCDHGGKYFGNQHVVDILKHEWTPDQHGAENLFKWIGEDASQPKGSFANNQAGQTAYGLAGILGDPNNQQILNSPDHPIGEYSPGVTRSLANTMAPYLGNFAGVTDYPGVNILNSAPTDSSGHLLQSPVNDDGLAKMFSVLDSDPQAARTINSAGMQWHDAIAYASGADTDQAPALLTNAESLQKAMQTGISSEISAHAAQRSYQASQEYADRGVFADGVTSVVQTAASITMGPESGPVVGGIAATVDSYIKADVIPNPADPAHPLADDKVSSQLKAINDAIANDPIRSQYLQVQSYVQQHPESAHYFDQPDGGNLAEDWRNVASGNGLNSWRNAYNRFAFDMNANHHGNIFPEADPSNNGPILESEVAPRGRQRPPGAGK